MRFDPGACNQTATISLSRPMKFLSFATAALFAIGVLSAQDRGKLNEREGSASVIFERDPANDQPPNLDGLAKLLAARDKTKSPQHIAFWGYFENDPTIQSELLKEYQTRYPKLLAGALKSSGNLHNPKVLPLASKFSECLLKTPTIAKIDAILLPDGYHVARAGFEKFWMDTKTKVPKFHAIVWLELEPNAPVHAAEKSGLEAGK